MKFPLAYDGLRKVFLAEVLTIVSVSLLLVAAIVGMVTAGDVVTEGTTYNFQDLSTAGLLIVALFAIAGGIIAIVALIFSLIGLNRAGQDEKYFKTAFYATLVALILGIVQGISGNQTLDSFLDLGGDLCKILVTIYVIYGIKALADKLGDPVVSRLAKPAIVLVISTLALSTILSFVSGFVKGGAALTTSAMALLVSLTLSLAAYIYYLIYIRRGIKMLEMKW